MNKTIEELRELMTISSNATEDEIMKAFNSIADYLKNHCVIKTQDGKYRILDFEFYFYNKNHQDITTHPRNSEALCWHINDFGGIDLNFKSEISLAKPIEKKGVKTYSYKYELTENSFFGGVLIRQIQRQSDKVVFDSPLKVADLFRSLDATSLTQKNPILEISDNLECANFQTKERLNLLGRHKNNPQAKADHNLKECFIDYSDSFRLNLGNQLNDFKTKKYRYCIEKSV